MKSFFLRKIVGKTGVAITAAILLTILLSPLRTVSAAADGMEIRRAFASKMSAPVKILSAPPGYCESWGGWTTYESISSVTLTPNPDGTYRLVVQVYIANPTGCVIGEPCPEYDESPEYVNVWIDWNGDGVWNPSEQVMNAALTGYFNINYWGWMTAVAQFSPPIDIAEDPTWLRANLGWKFDPYDPCFSSWTWGDVVDQQHHFQGPKIKNITAKGVGTPGENPETGTAVRLEAELETPLGYEVDACSWTGDLTPGNGDAANNCRYEYTPATGAGPNVNTYGEKNIRLTVTFRHTVSSATGQKSRNHTYKVFFKKGAPGSWGDDDGDGNPNWFEYWRANGAVPGLNDADVFYDQTLGANTYGFWSSGDDNVHVGGAAAMTHYPTGINVPAGADCPGGNFGGAKGIDCAAEVAAHEHGHKTIYHNWDFLGIWWPALLWPDSDRGVPAAGYNDRLPDDYELILGTSTSMVDSCDLATHKSATYATYGDNEFDVMTLSNGRTGVANNDWANPGKQSNPVFAPPGLFTQKRSTANMKSGPASPNAPYSAFPVHPLVDVGGLTGTYADAGVDTDGNGLYNSLKLSVGVEITLESMYNVVAWLQDGSGNAIAWANTQSTLAPGNHAVDLFFSGIVIRGSGKNGPYKIVRVELREGEIEDLVAAADNVHTTAAYLCTNFDLPVVSFTKTYTDTGLDTDADGLFNWLRIAVDLDVQVGGTYKIVGELEGTEVIAVAEKTVALGTGGQSVDLDFDGRLIFQNRQDGPYTLRRLRVEGGAGNRIDFINDAYTTTAYLFDEFQRGSASMDSETYSDQALDIDGDGDFDYLRVAVGIDVAQAGGYQLSADLTDGNGEFIASVEQTLSFAGAGYFAVTLDFTGSNIYQHGVDGPYRVSRVTLVDAVGNIADYQKVGHVTQAYIYTDFGKPWVALTGTNQDYGQDTNANSLYDQLVIEIGVLPDNPGMIVASGRLVDGSGNEIQWATNSKEMTAGTPQAIPLSFNGKLIRANRKNGPFKLTSLYVYNTGDPAQGASASLAHTTAAYKYIEFECEGICVAPDIEVTPTPVNFGDVDVGTPSDQTITVENIGNADLTLDTIGSPLPPFTKKAEGTCFSGIVLGTGGGAGGSCTIVVRFTPPAIGPFSSTFDISSNDPVDGILTVNLSGNGVGIPDITVTPLSVGFGSVLVGTISDQTVTVRNDGTADLTLGTIGTLSAPFSRTGGGCGNGQTLIPGGSCTITVSFTPGATGPFNSSFSIASNDPDESSVNVALSGTGIQQDITVTPLSVGFGSVLVGTISDQTVTVRNDGTADLTLGAIGTLSAPFSRAGGGCGNGQTLIPGGSCTITVSFTPGATGPFNSSFSIASNDPDESSVNVALSGTGIQQDITVTPLSVGFGNVLVGTSSDQTVTVRNDGTADLTLGTIGTISVPFSRADGGCGNGQTLIPGGSCTITVTFTPTGTGPFNSSFSIASNDPDESSVNVALSGTGIQQDITVTPLSVGFGNVLVGTSSDQTVTVRNDGTADLTLGTIGTISVPFSRADGGCGNGQTLIPGGSCTITVTFTPTGTGPFNSSFSIASNDPDESSVNVALSGTGIQQDITVTPLSVGFGSVLVGTSSDPDQTVTVRNDGTAPLTLGTIGSPSLPFSRAGGTCVNGQILAKGASCTIVIEFTPSLQGSFSSNFAVPSDDPDEASVTISLSGKGVLLLPDPPEGTLGSVIDITGSGFGAKKGKVLIGGAALKVLSWGPDLIQGTLSKVVTIGSCDVSILPKEPKGAGWKTESEIFTVQIPQIETVDPNTGGVGTPVKITGKFFGTKKGKVLLGLKSCKVVSWTMDPKTGKGEINILIPKKVISGPNELKVTNKVGEDTAAFTVP